MRPHMTKAEIRASKDEDRNLDKMARQAKTALKQP